MPRGPVRFPSNMLVKHIYIEEHNKKWLEEFKNAIPRSKHYYDILYRFFRFIEFKEKPFNTFTDEDVYSFLNVMWESGYSTVTSDTLISVLSTFKEFLQEKYPDKFDEQFLKTFSSLRDNPESIPYGYEPVTIDQLSAIREYNKNEGILYEYLFEVFFQLGIKREELKICLPKNRNKNLKCFQYNDKKIPYNKKIEELLDQIENMDEFVLNSYTVQQYVEKLTEVIRKFGYNKKRDFSYSDIKASHNAYFFKCPNCSRKLENIKENWVLVSSDFNNEYHLACAICKGAPECHINS